LVSLSIKKIDINNEKDLIVFSLYRKVLVVVGLIFCLFSPVYAYSGGSGTEADPCQIGTVSDWNDLMNTTADWNKHFILIADINLQGVVLTPVGNSTTNFTGVFDGNSHIIRNAQINMPGSNHIGLFGRVGAGGQIRNLGVEDINMFGSSYVGGLVGRNYGIITECYVTGSVAGSGSSNFVGGIVGGNYGSIIDCFSTGAVSGSNYTGGLIGSNSTSDSDVNTCYSTGVVTGGGSYVRGLVGYNYGDVITSFWDVNTSGQISSAGGEGKTTTEMKTLSTFTSEHWDFFGELENGYLDTWRMCVDGLYYPKLSWQFPLGDFVCPDGVDFYDFAVLAKQWTLEKLSEDIAPGTGDGIINFIDWAVIANSWQGDMNELADFTSQWLRLSAYCADIAPAGGDGVVDTLDFVAFAENWLEGT
jgi:hypothetical protein